MSSPAAPTRSQIAGPFVAPCAAEVYPVAEQDKTVMFTLEAHTHDANDRYIFTTFPSEQIQGRMLVKRRIVKGQRNIAILTNMYQLTGANAIKAEVEAQGGTVTHMQVVAQNDDSYLAQVLLGR